MNETIQRINSLSKAWGPAISPEPPQFSQFSLHPVGILRLGHFATSYRSNYLSFSLLALFRQKPSGLYTRAVLYILTDYVHPFDGRDTG